MRVTELMFYICFFVIVQLVNNHFLPMSDLGEKKSIFVYIKLACCQTMIILSMVIIHSILNSYFI